MCSPAMLLLYCFIRGVTFGCTVFFHITIRYEESVRMVLHTFSMLTADTHHGASGIGCGTWPARWPTLYHAGYRVGSGSVFYGRLPFFLITDDTFCDLSCSIHMCCVYAYFSFLDSKTIRALKCHMSIHFYKGFS